MLSVNMYGLWSEEIDKSLKEFPKQHRTLVHTAKHQIAILICLRNSVMILGQYVVLGQEVHM